jgi:hypothetical protein
LLQVLQYSDGKETDNIMDVLLVRLVKAALTNIDTMLRDKGLLRAEEEPRRRLREPQVRAVSSPQEWHSWQMCRVSWLLISAYRESFPARFILLRRWSAHALASPPGLFSCAPQVKVKRSASPFEQTSP